MRETVVCLGIVRPRGARNIRPNWPGTEWRNGSTHDTNGLQSLFHPASYYLPAAHTLTLAYAVRHASSAAHGAGRCK